MFFTRFFTLISSLTVASQALGMDLQTRSHPMCGTESRVSLENDPRCPVATYIAKSSAACAAIYNTKTDYKICGFDPARKEKRCEKMPGARAPMVLTGRDPELGCAAGFKEVLAPVPASCANIAFGVKGYETCQDPSHGIQSYQTCSREDFPIATYKTCSFYKTSEELTAYIQATSESVETYQLILPAREGELLSRLNSESAFACLIRKHEVEPMYDTVVTDLKEKFLLVFGYDVKDSIADCSDESISSTKIKFTLGGIDCDSIVKDGISTLVKPDAVSDGIFARFKQNCTMKKSYDGLVGWFDTKLAEVNLLKADIIAKSDTDALTKLEELRAKLEKK